MYMAWKRVQNEKGYPWLSLYTGLSWSIGLLVTIIVISTAGAFYMWYWQFGSDVAPDSIIGYGFAIAGTLCFVLAATLYTMRRRSHKRAIGQLNAALNWHIFCAIMGTAFLLMHSFGNFNAKTGTYALYSLLALMVSGFVGRVLDRIVPRLIAAEVAMMLTAQGEDRVESMLQHPRRAGIFAHPGELKFQAQHAVVELKLAQRAIQREQFYRHVLRYWRLLHIALALITIGLIIWHLVYVAQLLIPTFFVTNQIFTS